jgi:hypothetical protein
MVSNRSLKILVDDTKVDNIRLTGGFGAGPAAGYADLADFCVSSYIISAVIPQITPCAVL